MKCNETCKLFGAYQVLSGIKDNVVLIHSVVGCHFATMMHSFHTEQNTLNSCSTVINDKDIIFNGEKSLEYAINEVINLYNPKSISILTGCVAEIIKDDINAVIASINSEVKINHFDGTGFLGNFESGYEEALLKLAKKNILAKTNSINILGCLKDDYKLKEDILEIKRILEPEVTINCVIGDCTLEEIQSLTRAKLNIVFNRGLDLAKYMEKEFSIPYVVCDFPYGIEKSKEFLSTLETFFCVDYAWKKEELETYVLDNLKKVYMYLKEFYHLPVGIYMSKARCHGFEHFLGEELGMNPISEHRNQCSYEDFVMKFGPMKPAIVFGSTFETGMADELNAPLFPIEYPVLNRVSIGNMPYAMGIGAVNIVNDIINTMMILKYSEDKGAFYNEKNMYLW